MQNHSVDVNESKETVRVTPMPAGPLAPHVEKQTAVAGEKDVAVTLKRWKKEDTVKICSLVLRWSGFVFSFISFVVTVSNRQGKELNFEDYEEYSYVLAIAIMSTLYSAGQGIRQAIQVCSAKREFQHCQRAVAILDFVCDQIFAYLLISAASAAVPWTNKLRKELGSYSIVTKFTDSAAAAISMAFLAFIAMAASTIISGYRLSTLSRI